MGYAILLYLTSQLCVEPCDLFQWAILEFNGENTWKMSWSLFLSLILTITMIHEGLSYGEINSHLTKLSERLFERIPVAFVEIELNLEGFKFNSVNLEKDAEFEKHREHLGECQAQRIEVYIQ